MTDHKADAARAAKPGEASTGAQSHTFSWAEFSRRYEQHFGTTLPA